MKFILLILIVLISMGIGFFLLSKFADKNKKNILLAGLSLILLIVGYSMLQNKSKGNNLEKLLAFNNSKTLICKDIKVDIKNFNYVNGTLSFVAKKNSKYKGLTIAIEECQN